jgi:iron(III) transport system substrate-binding protein
LTITWIAATSVALALLAVNVWRVAGRKSAAPAERGEPLIVYCAHDAIYAQQVLDAFTDRTGIRVQARFDTEATKSLGLTELIARERQAPRCDVFWNNEPLGTMDLAEQGLLEPYEGPNHARIPAAYRDAQNRWAGFAARVRVWIVNRDQHAVDLAAIDQTLAGSDLKRVTMAKPLFGTTRAHYTALWSVMGSDALQAWHRDLRTRGLIEATSNGHTKNLVAQGACAIGWTDTDDFFVALDAGAHVAMLPALLPTGQGIVIPNTVALVRGSDQPEAARKLVDFLLSEEGELLLAGTQSRQVPLGPVDDAKLSDQVRQQRPWTTNPIPMERLNESRAATLAWLKSEYLQ